MPYRIVIEIAVGERGKTLELTGETSSLHYADSPTDAMVCAIAANALLWQSNNLASMAVDNARYDRMRRALNLPLNQVPY